MRKFHSYGPVDSEEHFCVKREKLVNQCRNQLVGTLEKSGHYFTIWAPRQAGKTWLMRRVKAEIENRHSDRFEVGVISMQGIELKKEDPPEAFLSRVPLLFRRFLDLDAAEPNGWEEFGMLFSKQRNIFTSPLILFIDEFDKLPALVIDRMVGMFRDIYLDLGNFRLHGLALIGVRAVLGVESERGSLFNIQRSLYMPNFTPQEVAELFRQYQDESGQAVAPEVVEQVFEATSGQPGLVGWFGELLTETYNPGPTRTIDAPVWEDVHQKALHKEWNNSILNLIKKAQGEYAEYVLELFARSDLPFSIRADWCAYLYLNGIIDEETVTDGGGKTKMVCRFSSPFVQRCLFDAFTLDLIGERMPILPLSPTDRITDVLKGPEIDLMGLMERYKAYLKRLKAKGLNPWKGQPRRADLHLTEAVGHFHLYAWLRMAIGRHCAVSPEFPTGNGRVDLHLECEGKIGIIEVKSFTELSEFEDSMPRAAEYARQLSLDQVMIALFIPIEDQAVLDQFSGESLVDGVRVMVAAIGWG